MKYLFLVAISACALALTACGGDSTSSDTTNNSTTTGGKTESKLCAGTFNGYKTAPFDEDGDGCLNTDELNKLKQKIAEVEARTVTALTKDIENTSPDFPKIELFSIIGSDASVTQNSEKYAVLDSSKHESKFTIKFRFNRNLDTDNSDFRKQESLRLGIGPYTSKDVSSDIGGKLLDHLDLTARFKDKGGITNELTCTYNSTASKYNCGRDVGFSRTSDDNLFLLMCQGSEHTRVCRNHANIKLKLK